MYAKVKDQEVRVESHHEESLRRGLNTFFIPTATNRRPTPSHTVSRSLLSVVSASQILLPIFRFNLTTHRYVMSGKETKDTAAASTANPPPSTAPSAVEAIEEDDEFEEFEPCQWNANDEDAEDSQQWQDNWDDDDIDDEFTMQLRAELSKSG